MLDEVLVADERHALVVVTVAALVVTDTEASDIQLFAGSAAAVGSLAVLAPTDGREHPLPMVGAVGIESSRDKMAVASRSTIVQAACGVSESTARLDCMKCAGEVSRHVIRRPLMPSKRLWQLFYVTARLGLFK